MGSTMEVKAVDREELLKELVVALAKAVQQHNKPDQQTGLFQGLAGELLFLWKVSLFDKELVDEAVFNHKLEFLQGEAHKSARFVHLGDGAVGIGWFLEYLNQAVQEDYDDSLCEGFDKLVAARLGVDNWRDEIELVFGLSGVAAYLSRRQKKTDQTQLFTTLVEHFESLAINKPDLGVTWSQPANSVYRFDKSNLDKEEVNLGLAHGVPGVICALIPALKIKTLTERVSQLLTWGCDWLLIQKCNEKEVGSYFSYSCCTKEKSRLAWCYGDLTIALTLARVGNAIGNSYYLEQAKLISEHASKRDISSSGVVDAGVCHGSVGLALIFKLLYQELSEDYLNEASLIWLDYSLGLYQSEGVSGMNKFNLKEEKYEEALGLLEGYSGIGLALLSFLGQEPDWTDCLMLS